MMLLSLLPVVSSAKQSFSKNQQHHDLEQHRQHNSDDEGEGGEAWFEEGKRNRFAVFVGYGWVPKGQSGAESEGTLVIPALGLDYERWLHPRFAIGWYNDFQLSTFVVEREGEHHEEEKFLEREYAFVTAVVGVLEVAERLAIYAGPGKEFEKNESFFVFKVGGEYEFPLPNLWSLSIGGSYDIRDLYDSWGFGISIGKRF
jgi:hypothetical protein